MQVCIANRLVSRLHGALNPHPIYVIAAAAAKEVKEKLQLSKVCAK